MFESILDKLIVRYRWVLVVFILLPLSTLYDIFYNLRCKLMFLLFTAPQLHDKRVKDIQRQVRRWSDGSRRVPMCTSRPGWQTMSFRQPFYKKFLYCINVQLIDILGIDQNRKVLRVEPLVTMGQITSILNPMGWTLPIVPELDDLTIGGLIMGCGVESSSHKYGLFQHICESYELVLADGCLIKCSREENADLFYAVPWSHGTLGFLVAAEIRIVPIKKYIRLEYKPVYSQDEMVKTFIQESNNMDNDFVEGLAYSKDLAVIMTGKTSDHPEKRKINAIGKWHKPWFFQHVRSFLKDGPQVEFIPIRDYYHRHSRSLFWEMQDIIPFGNNFFFRWLCGWMIPPKVSFLKLTQTETIRKYYEKFHVIQDILVPANRLKDTLTFFDKKLEMYPVWLCSFNLPNEPGFIHPHNGDRSEMYVDIGIYGIPKTKAYKPVETVREIEAFARHIHGFQMLYADTFQTQDEFHQMFDHSLYDRMRRTLDCSKAFPNVYDKIATVQCRY